MAILAKPQTKVACMLCDVYWFDIVVLCTISDYTSESIKRSPFRSPFYSGRTAYGGAASGQKVRVKRPRLETSPPPVSYTVIIRPETTETNFHTTCVHGH